MLPRGELGLGWGEVGWVGVFGGGGEWGMGRTRRGEGHMTAA